MSKGYVFFQDDGSIASTPGLLATVTGIDLKTTGQTTLYTVPAGKTLIIDDVKMLITASSVFATPAIVRIGKASSYNEWLPLTTLTSLSVVNAFIPLAAAALLPIHQTFAAGEVVKIDVQTGAGATTLTGTAYVYGLLV